MRLTRYRPERLWSVRMRLATQRRQEGFEGCIDPLTFPQRRYTWLSGQGSSASTVHCRQSMLRYPDSILMPGLLTITAHGRWPLAVHRASRLLK